MGALVESAVESAVIALDTFDVQVAAGIVTGDRSINEAQVALTSLVVTTIATQSPVAGDLRLLIAEAHVAYQLERIGDHCAGVARRVARLNAYQIVKDSELATIGRLDGRVLHGVLGAIVDRDIEAAREAARGDDEIDRRYHAYFERTLVRMRHEPDFVEPGAQLLLIAKELERIGDRATNIAEEVVLLETGNTEDLNP